MENNTPNELLELLKALADESRLALLRLLAVGERTVGDLAAQIELGEPTVSHHLSKLRAAGLVTLRMAGSQRFYRVSPEGLARFKRLASEIEQAAPAPESAPDAGAEEWISALGWPADEQRVLRTFTLAGKITGLPTKHKQLLVILHWLSTLFTPEQMYSEVEVNAILKDIYAYDYVSLRRDLISLGYLRRERGGGKYWLAPAGGPEEPSNGK